MSGSPRRSLFESPVWLAFCLIGAGWQVGSAGSGWVRIGWLGVFLAWAALLLRHLIKARRRRKSPPTEVR